MTIRGMFLVLSLIASSGSQSAPSDWQFSPDTGEAMIGLCIRQYAETTGGVLNDEADRAYVYSRPDVSWVVIARGEMGSFGEPEFNLAIFLQCDISTEHLRVETMRAGGFSNIIDVEPKSFKDFEYMDELLVASLYVRYGNAFVHSESRPPISREELGERLDRMYDSRAASRDLPEVLTIQ